MADFEYKELSDKQLLKILETQPNMREKLEKARLKTDKKLEDTHEKRYRYHKPQLDLEMRAIDGEDLSDDDITRLKNLKAWKNKYRQKNHIQHMKSISQKQFRDKILDPHYIETAKKLLDEEPPFNSKGIDSKKLLKLGVVGLGVLGAGIYGAKKLRDSRSDKGRKRGKYND
jgi:hypothetical protein